MHIPAPEFGRMGAHVVYRQPHGHGQIMMRKNGQVKGAWHKGGKQEAGYRVSGLWLLSCFEAHQ